MPLQPSYRNRGKSVKVPGSSRGSDRSQGGAFLSSVKEVLDDGASGPTKDAAPTEPRAQDPNPRSDIPPMETDPRATAEVPDIEAPRSKRSRTDQVDRPSRSSSSSRRGTIGWSFTHSKPGPILDDAWGLATLMRHMKRTGCSLPSINHLTNPDEYLDVAHHMGQLAGAINRAQLKFEEVIKDAPNARELAEVTELVKASKVELDQARTQVAELEAEVKRLGSKADAQQGKIESQALDLQVKGRKIADLESARRVAECQVKELVASSQVQQKNKEAEVNLAVRQGKKEVVDAYSKVLEMVKEKFVKKKDETGLQVYAQELVANTDLLEDLISQKIESAEEEYARLMALIPDATAAYEKAQVSDFSISKLPLPQISEGSGTFEINMFNPSFSGQYGSNLDLVGSDLAPVQAIPGGVNQEVDDGAPAKETAPAEEEKGAEEDPAGKDA